jgi:hypothetical protein
MAMTFPLIFSCPKGESPGAGNKKPRQLPGREKFMAEEEPQSRRRVPGWILIQTWLGAAEAPSRRFISAARRVQRVVKTPNVNADMKTSFEKNGLNEKLAAIMRVRKGQKQTLFLRFSVFWQKCVRML